MEAKKRHVPVPLVFLVFVLSISALASVSTSSAVGRFKSLNSSKDGLRGAQVIRVSFKDKDDLTKFGKLDESLYFDILHHSHSDADILVRRSALSSTLEHLKDSKFEYKVLVEDVRKKIDLTNSTAHRRTGQKFNFNSFHSVDDMYSYLDYLNTAYSGNSEWFVKLETIGETHEKRPLKVLRVYSGVPNAIEIFIDGGIHAREWVSPAAALYIAKLLTESRESLPDALKKVNFHILPIINADGYEYSRSTAGSRLWRKNRRPSIDGGGYDCWGVDLNRNFDYKWGGIGTSDSQCDEIFRGPAARSEPETEALSKYLDNHNNSIQAYVTLHAYGQYILYPWGYQDDVLPENWKDLQRVGETAARYIKEKNGLHYKVGSSAQMLYPAAGASDDYAKSRGIKFSYTVELRDTGSSGFLLAETEIEGAGQDAFEVIRAIAEDLM